jgi:hypothetical protein
MPGLDHLTGGTLSSGHRSLVHFQPAIRGTFWVATEETHLDGISIYLDDFRRELETVLQRISETVSAACKLPEAA